MPPHRNVHQGVFGSFGPDPFSYGAVPSAEGIYNQAFNDPLAYAQQTTEPSSNQGATVDIFEDMARSMREAFASFESVSANPSTTAAQAPFTSGSAGASATTNPQTTPPNATDANTGSGFTFQFPSTAAEHGLPRDGPFPPFPPLFTDHQPRPYGFNWSESTADGAAHPGSMPYNSSNDSGADQHHHHHHHHGHHGGPGGSRGRYTPYGRGGPPRQFHHCHHRPPPPFGPGPFPFGFGGPFGRGGPFGFRGPWAHWHSSPPPPFAASNMEEEFSRAREQQQESFQKLFERLNEMRSRMYGARHGRDDGFGAHYYPGGGRGGRGGYQSGRGRYESYAWGSGDGGAPPRSGARSRSAPARNVDIAKAWETYSAQWTKLTTADAPATIELSEVPWPVIIDTSKMKTLSDMASAVTATTVGEFILSPKHSPDVSNKKRIHQALRLYHPDRFELNVVAKLEEKDKKAVRELGEVVAKCLNKLLEKEN